MRIATLGEYYAEAIRRAGHTCVVVPQPPRARGFQSNLQDRLQHGQLLFEQLKTRDVDVIIDAHGDGLLYVEPPQPGSCDALLHHRLGVPLVSMWPETLRIYFKGLPPEHLWTALHSPSWFKAVAVRSHLEEMQWMGIPACFHLQIGAAELDYAPPVLPNPAPEIDVLFAGSQQSQYFAHADGVDTRTQMPGVMASAAVHEGSAATFLEVYQRYAFGEPPRPDMTPARQAAHAQQYYTAKLFYTAWRNLTLRDRFVLRADRHLGERFRLVGHARWADHYGLTVHPRVDYATYCEHIRQTPICLNMSNGDNTSGLNVRHYEIPAHGGFMLCYDVPEVHEAFEVGVECATFRSENELVAAIDHYLAHPQERLAIARAGQQRILCEHLLRYRVAAAVTHVQQHTAAAG